MATDPVKIFFTKLLTNLNRLLYLRHQRRNNLLFNSGEHCEHVAPPEQTAEKEPSYAVRRRLFAQRF